MAVSGISLVAGARRRLPRPGRLAVLGERQEAARLAERAESLGERWGMTAYLRWLAERRDTLRF